MVVLSYWCSDFFIILVNADLIVRLKFKWTNIIVEKINDRSLIIFSFIFQIIDNSMLCLILVSQKILSIKFTVLDLRI